MFENILNELNNLKCYNYKIDIPVDEEGYIDKECPNQECLYQFKIFAEDWKNICKDEAIYCPRCGKTATSDKWFTTEQIEESKQRAMKSINYRIGSALEKDARIFNRKQKNNFIKLNMKVSGFKKFDNNLPLSCKELIEQKVECKHCHTRYAVIGSAFYCPSCGNNSAINTFDEFIKTTYSKLNNLEKINNAIESKDDANRIIRALLESIPNDLVESIQCLSEAVYDLLPNKKKLKKNVFQRIEDSNNLWKEATDISFENWLTEDEFEKMKIYYQRRHLLIHTNGIVDEDYLNKTNDSNYRVGERIVFDQKSALEFTNIIKKVGEGIKKINVNKIK